MRATILAHAIRVQPLILILLSINAAAEIRPPEASEWLDRGTVLEPGSGWDARLDGAISPCTVIKKNGVYYLYYIGADGNRSTDGGPRNRALGVATSTDGINFSKYQGNPVITYLPHSNQEEGVFSAAATVDTDGDIVMYYGALHASNSTTEEVDVYVTLATSTDGFSFDDRGARGEFAFALDGEEVEPIGVVKNNGKWFVYYIDNRGWQLNLLTGDSMDTLSDAGSVSGTGGDAKGGGDPHMINGTEFISIIDHYNSRDPLVVRGSLDNPKTLTQVHRYDWGGDSHSHSTTYLDTDAQTWFMYYLNKSTNSIGVKTAPAVDDGTVEIKPKPPENLTAN